MIIFLSVPRPHPQKEERGTSIVYATRAGNLEPGFRIHIRNPEIGYRDRIRRPETGYRSRNSEIVLEFEYSVGVASNAKILILLLCKSCYSTRSLFAIAVCYPGITAISTIYPKDHIYLPDAGIWSPGSNPEPGTRRPETGMTSVTVAVTATGCGIGLSLWATTGLAQARPELYEFRYVPRNLRAIGARPSPRRGLGYIA